MKEFDKQLSDKGCTEWFKKLFGGIWNQLSLEEIIFLNKETKTKYYDDLLKRNNEANRQESSHESVAGFLGNSLWDIFSNNHAVYLIDEGSGFSIGGFRGSGSFIAEFIESESKELRFDYMDFYMGHFGNENNTDKSHEFIFKKLKENGFDWFYAYPELGVIDFSKNTDDKMEGYNPNKSLEDEINKQDFLKVIDKINEDTFNSIQNSPLPTIIRVYIKVFNKFPEGWVEN